MAFLLLLNGTLHLREAVTHLKREAGGLERMQPCHLAVSIPTFSPDKCKL